MTNTQRIQRIDFIHRLIINLKAKKRTIHHEELVGEIMDKWCCADRTAREYIKAALYKLKMTRDDL